jgi:hypothetical protein
MKAETLRLAAVAAPALRDAPAEVRNRIVKRVNAAGIVVGETKEGFCMQTACKKKLSSRNKTGLCRACYASRSGSIPIACILQRIAGGLKRARVK